LERPHKIENWIKQFPCNDPGVTKVLSAASMNDVYAEKVISYNWSPDLKLLMIEKCDGRNSRVSFEHVKQTRTEIGFTYFSNVLIGKMVCVMDNITAQ
jgi:hypothetical protein